MRNSPANCRAVSLRAFRGDVDLDAFGLFSRLIGCVVRPAEPELHDVFTDRIFTFHRRRDVRVRPENPSPESPCNWV